MSSLGSSNSVDNYKSNIDQDHEEEEDIEEQVGEDAEQHGSGLLLSYIDPDLSLSGSEIEKMQRDGRKKLLQDKKLMLVLDLDDLINSAMFHDLTDAELRLPDEVGRPDNLFRFDKHRMLVKLRPYIHDFLKEANNVFEMYLFTTRQQDFAWEVRALLDPENEYFSSRVICRPDNTTRIKNGLDANPGMEMFVIILDDNENVWENHRNHVVLEKYKFFAYTMKSASEWGKYETKSRQTLESILDVLKRAHKFFYDTKLNVDIDSRDVRMILDLLRENILEDCTILFSGVFPSDVQPEEQHIWKLAEGMGAICRTDVDDSVTHVMATDPNDACAVWARENSKFLVTTHWIVAAHYLWKLQEEDNFPVKHKH